MPTHKGTSQTDITIGSGGAGAAVSLSLLAQSPACTSAAAGEVFSLCLCDEAGGWLAELIGELQVSTAGRSSATVATQASGLLQPAGSPPTPGASCLRRSWRVGFAHDGRTCGELDVQLLLSVVEAEGLSPMLVIDRCDAAALVLSLVWMEGGAERAAVSVTLETSAWGDRSLSLVGPMVEDETP